MRAKNMPTNEIPAKKSLIRKQKQNYKNKQCTKNNIKNSPKLELENFKQKKKKRKQQNHCQEQSTDT